MLENQTIQGQDKGQAHPCACRYCQQAQARARQDFLALDVFRNSTEHEEYRPS